VVIVSETLLKEAALALGAKINPINNRNNGINNTFLINLITRVIIFTMRFLYPIVKTFFRGFCEICSLLPQ
jgi:hypothetical protein